MSIFIFHNSHLYISTSLHPLPKSNAELFPPPRPYSEYALLPTAASVLSQILGLPLYPPSLIPPIFQVLHPASCDECSWKQSCLLSHGTYCVYLHSAGKTCDSLLLVVFMCLYVLSDGQGSCFVLYDSHRTRGKEKQKFERQLKFLLLSTLNDISHVYIFFIPYVQALTLAYYLFCSPIIVS